MSGLLYSSGSLSSAQLKLCHGWRPPFMQCFSAIRRMNQRKPSHWPSDFQQDIDVTMKSNIQLDWLRLTGNGYRNSGLLSRCSDSSASKCLVAGGDDDAWVNIGTIGRGSTWIWLSSTNFGRKVCNHLHCLPVTRRLLVQVGYCSCNRAKRA